MGPMKPTPRRPSRPHPPFPFVWVPEEQALAKQRHYRIRPLVWVILLAGLLTWWFWPSEPQREGTDLGDDVEWLPQ